MIESTGSAGPPARRGVRGLQWDEKATAEVSTIANVTSSAVIQYHGAFSFASLFSSFSSFLVPTLPPESFALFSFWLIPTCCLDPRVGTSLYPRFPLPSGSASLRGEVRPLFLFSDMTSESQSSVTEFGYPSLPPDGLIYEIYEQQAFRSDD